jgi:Glycosyl hydrolases family 2, sugar binding domain/Glycosyl hydrolases family 2
MLKEFLIVVWAAWTVAPLSAFGPGPRSISIAGEWRLRLDPDDGGLIGEWFKSPNGFADHIRLPGSTDEQRFGNRNDGREAGHLTRAYWFVGPVWYQREITIPEGWQGKRIILLLERCHWETRAWLDDYPLGLRNSLSTPHRYELGAPGKTSVTPGPHRLTIRVDNRLKIDIGRSSAVTEQGPGNWNGIAGRMELQATDRIWIDRVFTYPNLSRNAVHVTVTIRNSTGQAHDAMLVLSTGKLKSATRVRIPDYPLNTFQRDLQLTEPVQPWSEFSPSVFKLIVSLVPASPGERFSDEARTVFGMRELSTKGRQMILNERVIHLRGTVDNGSFPRTGYPPTNVEAWLTRFQTYKDYGFNHVRFHSWCPPEAAFTAADELGLIVQVENPLWIPDGRVSADALRTGFIRQEAEGIVDTYGNHPSFGLMTMGNELGSGLDIFLGGLVRSLRARDPRHLYSSTSAPDNILRPDDYFVSAGPRWQNLRGDPRLERNPPDTDFDYRDYVARLDRPVIAHELGQWTVFPNLAEAREYDGPLQPRYLDSYREALERTGLLGQAEEFRRASGALMIALYKEEIESNLRTRGLAGFQLLGLTDWPGFGPAFIGVLDALGQSKGLIAPAAFRRFCGPTVLLLRMKKRTWTSNETLAAPVEIAHYGPGAIEGLSATWTLRNNGGRTLASGVLPPGRVPTGGLTTLGEIRLPLDEYPSPARYSIQVSAGAFSNDWDLWLYPANLPPVPPGLFVASAWDGAARKQLTLGRTVVLFLDPHLAARTAPTSFTTAFWALSLFVNRHETMGILCDPSHPALAKFPTDSHADWQWWDLMSHSRAFVLNAAPRGFQPIVQVIDDAARSYRLGAVFEARVAAGKLLAVSFDLARSLDTRLAARQLRYSLLRYAASRDFHPATELSPELLDKLFAAEDSE